VRTRDLVLLALTATSGVLMGCGWLVGVTGDVTLATDAGWADDEPDGAERPLTDSGDAQLATDAATPLDGADDEDAEAEPGRDASRYDAAHDARDD